MKINENTRTPVESLTRLTYDLTKSLKKPTRKTLSLIDKALSYLTPFERPDAKVSSPTERTDLLTLLVTHRLTLSPYIDTDRVERHLQNSQHSK